MSRSRSCVRHVETDVSRGPFRAVICSVGGYVYAKVEHIKTRTYVSPDRIRMIRVLEHWLCERSDCFHPDNYHVCKFNSLVVIVA